ncbi:MAG: hypothetical protein ACYC96_03950 [Fimbriimonadaceae bacterium]
MRLKDIDNPWLVVRLPLILGTFGTVVGAALAPMFVEIFHPDVTDTLDVYAEHHSTWYWNGAGVGLLVGLVLAIGTLLTLRKHEEQEGAAPPDAHTAH